jgi:hemerythrin superfamily protein
MGTRSTIATGQDVVSFLKGQHEQIKELFTRALSTTGKAREQAFVSLRRTMAVHETAEEEIVHPAAKRALGPIGERVVAKHLVEEREAKKALVELEQLDIQSREFDTKLRALEANVLAHAESEEKNEFSKLGEALDHTHLERMKRAVEIAESLAPTRPHPGVESPAANMIAGPFAAMVDRTRDLLSGKL